MQKTSVGFVGSVDHSVESIPLINFEEAILDNILEISKEELREFEECTDSASSEYSDSE